jgi:hypothetical protein
LSTHARSVRTPYGITTRRRPNALTPVVMPRKQWVALLGASS